MAHVWMNCWDEVNYPEPVWIPELSKEVEMKLEDFKKKVYAEATKSDWDFADMLDSIAELCKPKPQYRPYDADELFNLLGMSVKHKTGKGIYVITGVNEKHLRVCVCAEWLCVWDLLANYRFEPSRCRCGVHI